MRETDEPPGRLTGLAGPTVGDPTTHAPLVPAGPVDAACYAILQTVPTSHLQQARWRPLVAAALTRGWHTDDLVDTVTRLEGARSPVAVLASRLRDAVEQGPPPAAARTQQTTPLPTNNCTEHPTSRTKTDPRTGRPECYDCWDARQGHDAAAG